MKNTPNDYDKEPRALYRVPFRVVPLAIAIRPAVRILALRFTLPKCRFHRNDRLQL